MAKPNIIGVLCAVPEELAALRAQLALAPQAERHGPFQVWRGEHDGLSLAVIQSGIGKVNAASAATLLLGVIGVQTLVFAGVAGGLNPGLSVGDILLADRLAVHDYGLVAGEAFTATASGVIPIGAPMLERPEPVADAVRADLVALQARLAGRVPVRLGAVTTADYFLNCAVTRDRLHASFTADAIDMESGAVAQVAQAWGARLYVIRTLSDLAGDDSHVSYGDLAAMAARNSALCVGELLALLAEKISR